MREVLYKIGRYNHLQAVVTRSEHASEKFPTIVLLNAGVIHKAGPFSLNTFLARSLADQQFTCIRFDFSGMGDSLKGPDQGAANEILMLDMRDVMDFMERELNISSFVFVGLCTGADNAHKIAAEDKRVEGIVLLDGYGYTTFKFYVNRYLPKLLTFWRPVLGRFRSMFFQNKHPNGEMAALGVDDYVWKLPPKDTYCKEMQLLVERNVRCLYVYTGGVKEYYNYTEQYQDVFAKNGFMEIVTVIYKPAVNHTYMLFKDKRELLADVVRWLKCNFS